VNDIETFCEQNFAGMPVNIYILGHGHINGKAAGSIKKPLLNVKKFRKYISKIFNNNQVPSRIILTFCDGHNNVNNPKYKNIIVEAVTSRKIPKAIYFGRPTHNVYNISLMIFLLKIYLESICEVKFDS